MYINIIFYNISYRIESQIPPRLLCSTFMNNGLLLTQDYTLSKLNSQANPPEV